MMNRGRSVVKKCKRIRSPSGRSKNSRSSRRSRIDRKPRRTSPLVRRSNSGKNQKCVRYSVINSSRGKPQRLRKANPGSGTSTVSIRKKVSGPVLKNVRPTVRRNYSEKRSRSASAAVKKRYSGRKPTRIKSKESNPAEILRSVRRTVKKSSFRAGRSRSRGQSGTSRPSNTRSRSNLRKSSKRVRSRTSTIRSSFHAGRRSRSCRISTSMRSVVKEYYSGVETLLKSSSSKLKPLVVMSAIERRNTMEWIETVETPVEISSSEEVLTGVRTPIRRTSPEMWPLVSPSICRSSSRDLIRILRTTPRSRCSREVPRSFSPTNWMTRPRGRLPVSGSRLMWIYRPTVTKSYSLFRPLALRRICTGKRSKCLRLPIRKSCPRGKVRNVSVGVNSSGISSSSVRLSYKGPSYTVTSSVHTIGSKVNKSISIPVVKRESSGESPRTIRQGPRSLRISLGTSSPGLKPRCVRISIGKSDSEGRPRSVSQKSFSEGEVLRLAIRKCSSEETAKSLNLDITRSSSIGRARSLNLVTGTRSSDGRARDLRLASRERSAGDSPIILSPTRRSSSEGKVRSLRLRIGVRKSSSELSTRGLRLVSRKCSSGERARGLGLATSPSKEKPRSLSFAIRSSSLIGWQCSESQIDKRERNARSEYFTSRSTSSEECSRGPSPDISRSYNDRSCICRALAGNRIVSKQNGCPGGEFCRTPGHGGHRSDLLVTPLAGCPLWTASPLNPSTLHYYHITSPAAVLPQAAHYAPSLPLRRKRK